MSEILTFYMSDAGELLSLDPPSGDAQVEAVEQEHTTTEAYDFSEAPLYEQGMVLGAFGVCLAIAIAGSRLTRNPIRRTTAELHSSEQPS